MSHPLLFREIAMPQCEPKTQPLSCASGAPKCLIAAPDAGDILAALVHQGLLTPAQVHVAVTSAEVAQYIGEVDIVCGKPAWLAPHLHLAQKLRWLQSTFAGVEPLMVAGLPRNYQLTGVKGIFGPLMREYVFGKLLEIFRHFGCYHRQQQQTLWRPHAYQGLAGRTLMVVGLGSIGAELVHTGQHFGMRTLGVNSTGQSGLPLDGCYALDDLQQGVGSDALASADAIVFALPGTPALTGVVDAQFLKALKPGAVLVNVGRGQLIDERALLAALKAGQLQAAVLDVFTQEPLPEDHPFWRAPNLHLTPHISALTFTADIARIFADNYQRFQAGKPLLHAIDFARGY
ncbi:D-2-hydroxyacid dehydrogenase [Simiduia sp. 21SJ11W-1]|uniref:D-2-hydroxyacid dehydrogenase n=1 Tax=Simiduia sp. 21SJ11W-1 TaxID=2909669 RepID=UPI00209F890C|nr:D-2-hydroxyacid dehydrogenase [Simiduia sp. 21SJ11W-1]UTA49025.1 D-2-hydroxyacid dehydrogenase [Simiduia sp. 21SJ11W-1]